MLWLPSAISLLERRAAFRVVAVRSEHPRGGELPQLVPDHGLRDEHGHVLAAVVHRDRVPDHLGDDRGAPRPGSDDPLVAALVHVLDLDEQVLVDERAFLHRTRHLATPLSAAADDELVRRLALLARAALLLAPRRGGVPAARRLAFAAAQRVVHRVHGHAADGGTLVEPAGPAGLAERDQLVLGVAHDADGGPADALDEPHLAGREPERREPPLLGHQLDAGAGRAGHLGARAGLQLHGVDHGADRDVPQRQRVAGADVRALARHQAVADAHAGRREDVALLAVRVVEQGDTRAAVRVVLDRRDLRRHAVLVPAEVDDAVPPLVPAALVASGDLAGVVPAGLLAPL